MEDTVSGFCTKAAGSIRSGGIISNTTAGTKCGRWNPTTEQVKLLTDLFRSGLRTPSTDQIQKISSQLSFYGKIESKNVFYWFQNHKARERQKRRKVSIDEKDFVLKEDNHNKTTIVSCPPKSYAEIYDNQNRRDHRDDKVWEAERVIETLQLFPLNSFGDESCKEKAAFAYSLGTDQMEHPPLDLRLSFV